MYLCNSFGWHSRLIVKYATKMEFIRKHFSLPWKISSTWVNWKVNRWKDFYLKISFHKLKGSNTDSQSCLYKTQTYTLLITVLQLYIQYIPTDVGKKIPVTQSDLSISQQKCKGFPSWLKAKLSMESKVSKGLNQG